MPACRRERERRSRPSIVLLGHTPPGGIVYWNTIYTQLALDALPGRPADDELAGLMPTIFERVDALGIYTFDADRRAGQLRSLRAA
jgi:hypothetical protein